MPTSPHNVSDLQITSELSINQTFVNSYIPEKLYTYTKSIMDFTWMTSILRDKHYLYINNNTSLTLSVYQI